MNVMSELCAAYGLLEKSGALIPPFHAVRNADIEIFLDVLGGFISAKRLKNGEPVVIPVTPKSETRTSSVHAHPLCDTLRYVAADFACEKRNALCFRSYISELSAWAGSPFSCGSLNAVLCYAEKEHVYADLINSGVLDETDEPTAAKMLVSFTVDGKRLCEADEIRSLYRKFRESEMSTPHYSFASGALVSAAEIFPSGLFSPDDRAKLISANDTTGFTFRGRFSERRQAFSLGAEESHKAHIALKKLAESPAFVCGKAKYLMWRTDGNPVPNFFTDELSAKNFAPSETVLIKIEATSVGRLAVRYSHKSDMSALSDWLSSCRASFRSNEKTPPLCAFQRLCGGNTIDILLPCVLERRAVSPSIVTRVCEAILRCPDFGTAEYFRSLRAVCALVMKRRADCREPPLSPLSEDDRSCLFGRAFALCYFSEKSSDTRGRYTLCDGLRLSMRALPERTLRTLMKRLHFTLQRSINGFSPHDEIDKILRRLGEINGLSDGLLDWQFLCAFYTQLEALGEIKPVRRSQYHK